MTTSTRAELLAKLQSNPRFKEAKPGVAVIIIGAQRVSDDKPPRAVAKECDPGDVDEHRDAEADDR